MITVLQVIFVSFIINYKNPLPSPPTSCPPPPPSLPPHSPPPHSPPPPPIPPTLSTVEAARIICNLSVCFFACLPLNSKFQIDQLTLLTIRNSNCAALEMCQHVVTHYYGPM